MGGWWWWCFCMCFLSPFTFVNIFLLLIYMNKECFKPCEYLIISFCSLVLQRRSLTLSFNYINVYPYRYLVFSSLMLEKLLFRIFRTFCVAYFLKSDLCFRNSHYPYSSLVFHIPHFLSGNFIMGAFHLHWYLQ